MRRRIIILKGRDEIPVLRQLLLDRNPDLDVAVVHGLADLTTTIDRCNGDTRLIAFMTATIVPQELLSRLKMTPYNIHPGPPEYPGSHPESFAIWQEARTYGVTAHEMTARVDAGPIVAVYRFPMPPMPEYMELAGLTLRSAIGVYAFVAAFCAATDDSLPRMEEQWACEKTTRKQFQALCQTLVPASSDEAARLTRACGSNFVRADAVDVSHASTSSAVT